MMWRQLIRRCLLVLLVLGLAACKKYTIVEPVADSLHTAAPATFKVTYSTKPATPPGMQLNGFNVGTHFTFGQQLPQMAQALVSRAFEIFRADRILMQCCRHFTDAVVQRPCWREAR